MQKIEGKLPNEFQTHLVNWFKRRGVNLLDTLEGNEISNESWLYAQKILQSGERIHEAEIVTELFLSRNKDFGEGWFRGGAESFYKIIKIDYISNRKKSTKHIAFKAIHTLGNIQEKTLREAAWMAELYKYNRTGRIYAVGQGTIVKDFLLQDDIKDSLSDSDKAQEVKRIVQLMNQIGLSPMKESLEYIQNNGRLKLIDLGSGDIDGPDLFTFIRSTR
jgi:hypothetical protein